MKSCAACIEELSNQEAHMEPGGCMAPAAESDATENDIPPRRKRKAAEITLDESTDASTEASAPSTELCMDPPDFEPELLAKLTPHPLDPDIRFTEEDHKYYVRYPGSDEFVSDGVVSTTALVHQYFPHFDADTVLVKMRRSRKFAHGPYAGMTNDEIKAQWADNAHAASTRGTQLHLLLECHNNGFDLAGSRYARVPEVQDYFRWRARHFEARGLRAFRTELRMRTGPEHRVTGMLDLLAIARDHPPPEDCGGVLSLHIIDWKFSRAIKRENRYENGSGPCADLPACNFSTYALQQNLYQWMLEKFYGEWDYRGHKYTSVRVVSKHLAVFHPNHGREGLFVELPDMQDRVEQIMEERKEAVLAASGGP